MLTDKQISVIETAASEFSDDVQQLAFGIREYQRALREANSATRFNSLIMLQRMSPEAYQRVLATISASQRQEVTAAVATSVGKELPKITATKLSESIKIKPLGGPIKVNP